MIGAKNIVCEDDDGLKRGSNYGNRIKMNCKIKPRLEREKKIGLPASSKIEQANSDN